MSFTHPEYLVETEWLAAHLNDTDLRVLDCTVFLHPNAERGFRIESGYDAWRKGHIPGSAFADLLKDLSDQSQALMFMMPSAKQFADAMSRYGVGEGTRVVLYDALMNIWAARVWWMLRAFGFDNAMVLNGGWRKWTKESRATSTDPPTYPPASFVARPRPELIANKQEVFSAIGDSAACILNALSAEEHAGKGPARYRRPGRIPASVNVPFRSLIDPETHAYLPAEQLRAQFVSVGATSKDRVITYCGGGIAASSDAFILTLLGKENVAVYDGSLSEWTADPDMPMETE
jgi:thiosulfate/3-mercaptopyruvate sulfurtransferase